LRIKEQELRLVLIIATVMFILSYWIHLPAPFGPVNFYSDITSLYHLIFTKGERWFIKPSIYGLPYIDYFLEYPIIVGVCFALSSIPRILLDEPLGLLAFYHIMTLILYIATIICVKEVYFIIKMAKLPFYKLLLFFICTLSFILYTVYNWDIIASAFMMMSIRLLLEKKYYKSAISLGLAVSSKLIPGVLIIPIIFYLPKMKNVIKYIIIVLATYVLLNIPIMIFNFKGWLKFWEYHLSWYVEGSWLQIFFEYYDPTARIVSKIVFTILMAIMIIFATKYREGEVERFLEGLFLFLAAALFSSYVFTPQMSLLLYPLIATLPSMPLALFFAFDFTNAAIMMFWFTYNEWVEKILGYKVYVFDRSSPITILIAIKCFILLLMILYNLHSKIKFK